MSARRAVGGGWELTVVTERFRLSLLGPELTPSASTAVREGHAHLFVDGQLRGMVVSTPRALPALAPGAHTLTVQLNTPDHRTLLVNGAPIEGRVTIVEPVTREPGS